MTHAYRFILSWLAVLATFSAMAQPAAATWHWATTPLDTAAANFNLTQVLDAARQRLYVLTESGRAQQLGNAPVAAGIHLHTFNPTTGQWLAAERIGPAGSLTNPRLTLDPATGDVLLLGQLNSTLHLGPFTVGTAAQMYREQALLARYHPTTQQWRWAREATAEVAAYEGAVVLPGGDVVVSGSFVGNQIAADGQTLVRTTPRSIIAWSAAFVGRLDGATGACQWLRAAGGRALSSLPASGSGSPGNLTQLAFDATTNQALLCGESDMTAAFGPVLLPAGPYLARLDVATGQWVGATALPACISTLATDDFGNTYLAGVPYNGLGSVNTPSLYAARLDAQDHLVWEYREPPVSPYWLWPQQPISLAPDAWGNVFLSLQPLFVGWCGNDDSPMPVINTRLLNLDAATGGVRWELQSQDGGSAFNYACAVSADGQGGAYVAGNYRGAPQFGASALPASPASQPYLAHVGTPAVATRSLNLWPNPAGQRVWLAATPNAPVEIVDARGRTVRTTPLTATGELDLTGLAPGLYVVRAGGATARLVVE